MTVAVGLTPGTDQENVLHWLLFNFLWKVLEAINTDSSFCLLSAKYTSVCHGCQSSTDMNPLTLIKHLLPCFHVVYCINHYENMLILSALIIT